MSKSPFLVVAAALLAAALPSQSIISNIGVNTTANNSSLTTEIAVAGGLAYFSSSGNYGRELYVSDGTQAGSRLLIDLATFDVNPGQNADPRDLTPLGAELLFTANVDGLGRELWKTDGTPAGTRLVRETALGTPNGDPRELTRMGNKVFFTAFTSPTIGRALWVTDGTAAGTQILESVANFGGGNPTSLVVSGGFLYFAAALNGQGTELWRTDGTPGNAAMVADIVPGSVSSTPTKLTALGSGVVFEAFTPATSREPHYTDGTAAGTVLLADIHPTSVSNMQQITPLGSLAVFVATDGATGAEPWVTDGTPAGTVMLRDIRPGSASSVPEDLMAYGGHVYFGANDGTNGAELWRTDGTPGGTSLFVNLEPGVNASRPLELAVIGGELWFSAQTFATGREPWKSDGTVAGTVPIADIDPTGSSSPSLFTPFGGGAVCSMAESGTGTEPAFLDGSAGTGFLLIDANPGVADSSPDNFAPFPGGAFFTALDPVIGDEGFFTDGTPGGTIPLDLAPGITPSRPQDVVLLGSEVFFNAQMGVTRDLWKSDGTLGGTVQLTSTGVFPQQLTVVNGRVVFIGTGPNGAELWASDGTAAGTAEIADIRPGAVGSFIDFVASNGSVALFRAFNLASGNELWRTDGTPGGTFVIELAAGTTSSDPNNITAVDDGRFFFSAWAGPTVGRLLWVSDGTVAGTVSLPFAPAAPIRVTPSDNRVFYLGNDGGSGLTLCVSDGTPGGSRAIDLIPGPASTVVTPVGASGGAYFLWDGDGSAFGSELFFSDGTAAGTFMVADIAPGYASGPVNGTLTPVFGGTQILFQANDLQTGLQLWTSDGTVAGTHRVTRFAADAVGAAWIGEVLATGTRVFLAADDGIQGKEPWVLEPGVAFQLTYGNGCAGPGQQVPAIGWTGGLPTLGNAGFRVDVTSGTPGAFGFLLLGYAPSSANLGAGCTRLLQFPIETFRTAVTNGAGYGSAPVPIPSDPSLEGLNAFFQWGIVSPTGPFLSTLDLSDGLQVQLGN